jgi:hypothetical protein
MEEPRCFRCRKPISPFACLRYDPNTKLGLCHGCACNSYSGDYDLPRGHPGHQAPRRG